MANGLDRLERLFAYRRKASPAPNRQSVIVAQPSEPQFPSPSFIRPKTTRMAARDEVRLKHTAGRSPSVPDIITAQRIPAWANSAGLRKNMPEPATPSSGRQDSSLVSGLREFLISEPPSRHDDGSSVSVVLDTPSTGTPRLPSPRLPSPRLASPRLASPGLASPGLPSPRLASPRLPSPRCLSPTQAVPPPSRLATPPSSVTEDSSLFLSGLPDKPLPDMPYRAPPTPQDTPDFGPVEDAQLVESTSLDSIDQDMSKSSLDLGDSFDQLSLHRTYSQSSLAPSAQLSFCSSTLREPDFNEFLNLSDDDIAELTPESPMLPSEEDSEPALPPMGLSISSSLPLTSSLLTLTPPRASRLSTIAAYEAARIARNYDFDLVYVVNLWPDNAKPQIEGLGSDHGQGVAPKPMMGRLLAAHGLDHVPSPLQISSRVHTAILRSDGWIEYRNPEAQGHDLARGFACAFYTGHYTRSGQPEPSRPVSGVRLSEQIDRGIVFAAYRKPRMGADRLGRSLSEEDLGELHRESEALVEMLIDIHVASRLCQPPTQRSVTDETGPMPLQQTRDFLIPDVHS